ncbi:hypothetical protein TWF506_005520 [Arthrobotrys conoides]|uniref:Uncharacterized protein n=1 Tax=Arthrobotrys conoides TaxID=74498 RepID=A0AAN8NWM8_9PEZI
MDDIDNHTEPEPTQSFEAKPSSALKGNLEYYIPRINRSAAIYPHRLTEEGVIELLVTTLRIPVPRCPTDEDIQAWSEVIGKELLLRRQVTEDVAREVGLQVLSHFAKTSENFLRTIHDISHAKEGANARLEAWKARVAEEEQENMRLESQQALLSSNLEVGYQKEQDMAKSSLTVTPASPFVSAKASQSHSRSTSSAAAIVARISEYEQPSAWSPTELQITAPRSETGSQMLLKGPDNAVSRTFKEMATQTSQTDSNTELKEFEENKAKTTPQYPLMKFDFPPPGPSFAASAKPEVLVALEKFGRLPVESGSKKRKRKKSKGKKRPAPPQPVKETQSSGTQTSPHLITPPSICDMFFPTPIPTLAHTNENVSTLGNPAYRTGVFGQTLGRPGNLGKQPVRQYRTPEEIEMDFCDPFGRFARRRALHDAAAQAALLRTGGAQLKANFGPCIPPVSQTAIVHTNPGFAPIRLLTESCYLGSQQSTGNGPPGASFTNTIGQLSEASTVAVSSETETTDEEESGMEGSEDEDDISEDDTDEMKSLRD